jgi:hypothetical protein
MKISSRIDGKTAQTYSWMDRDVDGAGVTRWASEPIACGADWRGTSAMIHNFSNPFFKILS